MCRALVAVYCTVWSLATRSFMVQRPHSALQRCIKKPRDKGRSQCRHCAVLQCCCSSCCSFACQLDRCPQSPWHLRAVCNPLAKDRCSSSPHDCATTPVNLLPCLDSTWPHTQYKQPDKLFSASSCWGASAFLWESQCPCVPLPLPWQQQQPRQWAGGAAALCTATAETPTSHTPLLQPRLCAQSCIPQADQQRDKGQNDEDATNEVAASPGVCPASTYYSLLKHKTLNTAQLMHVHSLSIPCVQLKHPEQPQSAQPATQQCGCTCSSSGAYRASDLPPENAGKKSSALPRCG